MPTPSLAASYPYYLAGRAVTIAEASGSLPVVDKFTGKVVAQVAVAGPAAVEAAIVAAVAARAPMKALRPHQRAEVLTQAADAFEARAAELAHALCVEAGKPIRDARGEVTRLIETFRIAAEEAVRIDGEMLALDRSPRSAGLRGLTQRVPIGACSFITPFNFPLNLVAHKVAPAIAAGCPFVLRPSDHTPLGALIIGEVLARTALPPGAFSILPCSTETARPLVEDDRLAMLSFTGGSIGWDLRARAGKKEVVLELGGNASCIVDETYADAVPAVIDRLIFGGYYQSGQSCISVQHVLVHDRIYDDVRTQLVAKVQLLVHGDPHDEATVIGPVIDDNAAERLERWIGEAVAGGARLLCGGTRDGNMVRAAVLENVPADCDLARKEAFGPVVLLARFTDFDAALATVNTSDYGLQAGVFTRDLARTMRAWDTLEVGGVIIGDVPSVRVDAMPYGGIKGSGTGKEGVRSAIAGFTVERLLLLKTV